MGFCRYLRCSAVGDDDGDELGDAMVNKERNGSMQMSRMRAWTLNDCPG